MLYIVNLPEQDLDRLRIALELVRPGAPEPIRIPTGDPGEAPTDKPSEPTPGEPTPSEPTLLGDLAENGADLSVLMGTVEQIFGEYLMAKAEPGRKAEAREAEAGTEDSSGQSPAAYEPTAPLWKCGNAQAVKNEIIERLGALLADEPEWVGETKIDELAPSLNGAIMEFINRPRETPTCKHMEHDVSSAAIDILEELPHWETEAVLAEMRGE